MNITKIILDITSIIYNNIYTEVYYEKKNSIPYTFRIFANIIDNVFLKYTPPGMFITQRPPNVINNPPFKIG